MAALPETSNFYSCLNTKLTCKQIAELYGAAGWRVRRCAFAEYEISCEWAELVVEADSPTLMHGAIASIVEHSEELVLPLRLNGVSFRAECYGPKPDQQLLLELSSE